MKYHFIDEELPYTGEELSNHWAYKNYGILGDSIMAFIGPCKVDQTKMVDLEDVLNNDFIYSPQMLNFIIEIFGPSLREGVLIQRLYTTVLQGKLNQELNGELVKRRGDDLFYQDTKKLSVSICTVSPTSILIHTGLNVDATGAPVEAAGLTSDMGMENIKSFALSCMKNWVQEWKDIKLSCCKVKAVN